MGRAEKVISNKPAVLAIRCDVVAPNVPMLLSLSILNKLKGRIDFEQDSLSKEIGEFRPKHSKTGHLVLAVKPKMAVSGKIFQRQCRVSRHLRCVV